MYAHWCILSLSCFKAVFLLLANIHIFALLLQISEEDIAEGFIMRTINMKSGKVLY